MPALAQIRPLRVSTIRTRSLRTILSRLGEDQLDQARVLVEGGGELARPRARLDLAEPALPALGLGDDLLGDHDDVAVGELGGGRDHLAELVARTGSPAARRPAGARPGSRRLGEERLQDLRRRGRPGAIEVEARGQLAEIVAGVEVEGHRRDRRDPAAGARLLCEREVACAAVGPERGLDHVGRGEDQAVGPGPVPVGNDRDARSLRVELAVDLGALEQRACRRGRGRRTRRRARSRRRCRSSPPPSGRASSGSSMNSAPPSSATFRASGSPLTTTIRSTRRALARARGGRRRASPSRAPADVGAAALSESRDLARSKRLIGTIAVACTVSLSFAASPRTRASPRPRGGGRRRPPSGCRSGRSPGPRHRDRRRGRPRRRRARR